MGGGGFAPFAIGTPARSANHRSTRSTSAGSLSRRFSCVTRLLRVIMLMTS